MLISFCKMHSWLVFMLILFALIYSSAVIIRFPSVINYFAFSIYISTWFTPFRRIHYYIYPLLVRFSFDFQVLSPDMSLATVRTYIWKKHEDLILNYRVVHARWLVRTTKRGEFLRFNSFCLNQFSLLLDHLIYSLV